MKAIILLAFMLSTLVASATEQTVSVQLSDDERQLEISTETTTSVFFTRKKISEEHYTI